MYAYEGDTLVYTARCATGAAFAVEGVDFVDFITPIGEHTRGAQAALAAHARLAGRSDEYDFPVVPFCTYFTQSGIAVHGAYGRNDFGHPRSHGCVNVLAEDAKWVYWWSQPYAKYEDTCCW